MATLRRQTRTRKQPSQVIASVPLMHAMVSTGDRLYLALLVHNDTHNFRLELTASELYTLLTSLDKVRERLNDAQS